MKSSYIFGTVIALCVSGLTSAQNSSTVINLGYASYQGFYNSTSKCISLRFFRKYLRKLIQLTDCNGLTQSYRMVWHSLCPTADWAAPLASASRYRGKQQLLRLSVHKCNGAGSYVRPGLSSVAIVGGSAFNQQ